MNLASEIFKPIIKEESEGLLRAMDIKLTAYADNYIPLDIDVSPLIIQVPKKKE